MTCLCGCGTPVPLARTESRKECRQRGRPLRYVPGHARRVGREPIAEDRGFDTPCLIWQGKPTKAGGYGRTTRNGKTVYAHRASYEDAHGPVPENHDVHHRCGVKMCVNSDHLEAVEAVEHRTPNLRAGRC